MALKDCTDFVGRRLLITETPSRRQARNVVFIPPANGPYWGLFEPSGRAVTEAMVFTGDATGRLHVPIGSTDCPALPADCPTLDPAYDYVFMGHVEAHFGHMLVGSFSRLWALPSYARTRLRIIYSGGLPIGEMMALDFFRTIVTALGLEAENFLRIMTPVRIASIDVPAASMEELSLIHAVFADLTHAIGRQIVPGGLRTLPARAIYMSKERLAHGNVRVENEGALTGALQRWGVGIVYPEELTFREQLKLWASNPTVIGFSGSSLHGSAFFPRRNVVVLSHGEEMWVNQCLIDMANRNEARYLYEETGLEPVGPSDTFNMNYRIRDPEAMAADLSRIVYG